MKVAKITDTGKIVQILRIVDREQFSDALGWVLIDPDLSARDMTGSLGANIKWIPASTRFDWVRDISFSA